MKIQLDIPKEMNKNLKIFKVKNDLTTLQEAINLILECYFHTNKDPCRGDKNDQNGTALMPNSQCVRSKASGGKSSTTNTPTNLKEVNSRD